MSETRDVVLAIDIGDAKLAAGLMTMKGELLDRDDVDIDFGMNAETLFASLNTIAQAQLERARTHHNARPAASGSARAPAQLHVRLPRAVHVGVAQG